MNYVISLEDALDHINQIGEFDNLEDAKAFYNQCLQDGPTGYDIALELASIDDDMTETIEYHEWFTQEEWEAAHPDD